MIMKLKLPTSNEIFELLVEELRDDNFTIAGDITRFKRSIYREFKNYIKENEVTEETLDEHVGYFIGDIIDALFDDDEPGQIPNSHDDKIRPKAAGSDITSYQ